MERGPEGGLAEGGEGAKAEAEVVRARRATDLSWNCPGPRKGIAEWADGRGRRCGVVSAENWEERDVDRIGSDRIGSDRIGSDRIAIGSDRPALDSPWGGQTDAGTDRCAGRLGAWIAMMQWSGGIEGGRGGWLHYYSRSTSYERSMDTNTPLLLLASSTDTVRRWLRTFIRRFDRR